ncbi:DNA polymerase III epsilon subunit [Leifsonia rubra CMS 76R]|nr:DNA polymerase III epsilon subunit [Leifsonia rubra CMS 76R]
MAYALLYSTDSLTAHGPNTKNAWCFCNRFPLPAKRPSMPIVCYGPWMEIPCSASLRLASRGDPTDRFYGYADMVGRCEGHSYLIYNSQKLLEQCQFSFYFQAVKNRRDILGSDWEDFDYLRQETYKGAIRRYGNLDEIKEKRIIKELEIIQQKGFVSYFLINYDIVNFAQHKNFFYVGRGSGANSIVAYCLAITDVDPIELDLYFERFINLYRENPPDFDLDFSWKDRDEITHYIFDTYNQPKQDHVCLLATFNTFQYNSVLRELGKVFGLPKSEIESLIYHGDKLESSNYIPDQYGKLIYQYAKSDPKHAFPFEHPRWWNTDCPQAYTLLHRYRVAAQGLCYFPV